MVLPLPHRLASRRVSSLNRLRILKMTVVVRQSGFAVVFAEDVPDVQSADVPTGE